MTLTPENKAARRGLFTASEIHKLITPGGKLAKSETREAYVMEVAFELATGWRRQISSKQMEHGSLNEWEAFNLFEQLFPGQVVRNDTLLVLDNIGATPDGFVIDFNNNHLATIDIKCPWSKFLQQKALALRGEVPHEYYWQAQCQMYCAGVDHHYLVRYFTPGDILDDDTAPCELPDDKRIYWQRIDRNQPDIDLMVLAVNEAVEDRNQYIELINTPLMGV